MILFHKLKYLSSADQQTNFSRNSNLINLMIGEPVQIGLAPNKGVRLFISMQSNS